MKAEIALLISTLGAIAIVGLIVRNGGGFATATKSVTQGGAGLFAAVINPSQGAQYFHTS